ncbi:MAG: dynamin family protein [Candidatus Spyradosoma sp.]
MLENSDTLRILQGLFALAKASEERKGIPEEAKTFFQELQNDLRPLIDRCTRSSSEYKIAFVGLTNTGKSTLLNSLLGEKVAPESNGQCTASIVEFRYGENYLVRANRPASNLKDMFPCTCAEETSKKLNELCAHAGNKTASTKIRVSLPSSVLKSGLVLVDTPGFGAAGTEGSADEKLVKKFLRDEVTQIFWVASTRGGGVFEENALEFYDRFLKLRCDDLIMNSGGKWNEEAKKKFLRRYIYKDPRFRKTFRVHFVENSEKNDSEKSGIEDIVSRVLALKEEDGRFKDVLDCLNQLGEWCGERMREMHPQEAYFLPTRCGAFIKKFCMDPKLPELQPWEILLKEDFERYRNSWR